MIAIFANMKESANMWYLYKLDSLDDGITFAERVLSVGKRIIVF